MSSLIVNGDDFGMSPGVSAGIVEAHVSGILTSTSLLVSTPFSPAAAVLARAHPDLSVGLHFCLTDEDGHLTVDPAHISDCRAELRRQYDRFVALIGADPTHLDSHHHVHRDDRLQPLFLEIAEQHDLPLREHSSIRYFSAFYGQWDGETHPEQIGAPALEAMLRAGFGDGPTELGCHPGQVDSQLRSAYYRERELELTTLCAGSLRRVLEDCGLCLMGFRDVTARPMSSR